MYRVKRSCFLNEDWGHFEFIGHYIIKLSSVSIYEIKRGQFWIHGI